ncbi:MAG TPA: OmpH family outer membrane protein [Planctomycetota bacterium]|nr:OmpH family outer membrane protein [Planctomycetota bacterium]
MIRRIVGVGILGVTLLSMIVANVAAQSSEPKARPLLVGVVDLGVVLARYERSAEVSRQLEREKSKLDARLRDQERAIEKMRQEVAGTSESTAEGREKSADLALTEKAFEAMKAESDRVIGERFEVLTLQVIEEIDAAVHEYARANHFDLILKTTTKGWGEKRLPERIYRAQISTVVAYSPALDVTEAVLRQLNAPESPKK